MYALPGPVEMSCCGVICMMVVHRWLEESRRMGTVLVVCPGTGDAHCSAPEGCAQAPPDGT
jgi:hypothetical protein